MLICDLINIRNENNDTASAVENNTDIRNLAKRSKAHMAIENTTNTARNNGLNTAMSNTNTVPMAPMLNVFPPFPEPKSSSSFSVVDGSSLIFILFLYMSIIEWTKYLIMNAFRR